MGRRLFGLVAGTVAGFDDRVPPVHRPDGRQHHQLAPAAGHPGGGVVHLRAGTVAGRGARPHWGAGSALAGSDGPGGSPLSAAVAAGVGRARPDGGGADGRAGRQCARVGRPGRAVPDCRRPRQPDRPDSAARHADEVPGCAVQPATRVGVDPAAGADARRRGGTVAAGFADRRRLVAVAVRAAAGWFADRPTSCCACTSPATGCRSCPRSRSARSARCGDLPAGRRSSAARNQWLGWRLVAVGLVFLAWYPLPALCGRQPQRPVVERAAGLPGGERRRGGPDLHRLRSGQELLVFSYAPIGGDRSEAARST